MGGAESSDEGQQQGSGGCLHWLHMSVLACCFGAMIAYRPAQTAPFAELEGDVPGSPFFGHAFELLHDVGGGRDSWLAARCREHGAVSRLYMLGDDCVLLCGAKMASVFASQDLVDHGAAATAVARAQLWLASPHRVSATTTAEHAAAYSRAAADRLAQVTATARPQQDAKAALLAVAESANESPVNIGRELLPHVFTLLWRTLFASDGIALQQTYLDVARDTMGCIPIDVGSAYPSVWPEAWRWRNCFSTAAVSKREHLIPVLLDEIRLHRLSLGPVLGGDKAQTPEDAMATAEAAHDFILRTLHTSAMVLTHAFQALASDQADTAGDGKATSGGADITARAHRIAVESRRLAQPAAWSYGVTRSDLNLSTFHANEDCHADCPSCSTPCQPYTTAHLIPAGTQLLMAWNSIGMDKSTEGRDAEERVAAGEGVGHEVDIRTEAMLAMAGMGHSAGQAVATDVIVEHALQVAIRAIEQGQLQLAVSKEQVLPTSHSTHQSDVDKAGVGSVTTLIVAA
eukprot:COSAG02_NODE_9382_length_2236_cov_1.707534_1_plen_516_part_00